MFPLIETIRVMNGKVNNLLYHQRRMQKSLCEITGQSCSPDLEYILNKTQFPAYGLHKCRVIYTDKKTEVEVENYNFRPVTTLRLVRGDGIEYGYKFKNRSRIDELFAKRDDCDDILIIKDGFVTDSSYANILFRKGNDWITPASYLLAGTQRSYLLDQAIVREEIVKVDELNSFPSFKLINSMLLTDGPEVSTDNIKI